MLTIPPNLAYPGNPRAGALASVVCGARRFRLNLANLASLRHEPRTVRRCIVRVGPRRQQPRRENQSVTATLFCTVLPDCSAPRRLEGHDMASLRQPLGSTVVAQQLGFWRWSSTARSSGDHGLAGECRGAISPQRFLARHSQAYILLRVRPQLSRTRILRDLRAPRAEFPRYAVAGPQAGSRIRSAASSDPVGKEGTRHMAKRTTHRSSAGKKLYAVRDASGRFKDIQTYERAHRTDLKKASAGERKRRGPRKPPRSDSESADNRQFEQARRGYRRIVAPCACSSSAARPSSAATPSSGS